MERAETITTRKKKKKRSNDDEALFPGIRILFLFSSSSLISWVDGAWAPVNRQIASPSLSYYYYYFIYIYMHAQQSSSPNVYRYLNRNDISGVMVFLFFFLFVSIGKANHKRRRRQGKSRLPVLRHWRGIAFCLLDCGFQPDTRTAKEKMATVADKGRVVARRYITVSKEKGKRSQTKR